MLEENGIWEDWNVVIGFEGWKDCVWKGNLFFWKMIFLLVKVILIDRL